MRFSLFFLFNLFIFNQVISQITTDNAAPFDTPEFLVDSILLGEGVVATNHQYQGGADQIGFFNGLNTNIGIDSGIVLCTGDIDELIPNGFGGGAPPNNVNDPDLLDLANSVPGLIGQNFQVSSVNDIAILEFDFIPASSFLSFKYVFASVEYFAYENTEFNDVFGFFISGPGITGPYESPPAFPDGSINIATFASTEANSLGVMLPITVSSVQAQYNSDLFVSNQFGGDDNGINTNVSGYTTVFTAEANVTCGALYHIKLAIADGSDSGLSSFVMLEAGSFSSPELDVINSLGIQSPNIYSECGVPVTLTADVENPDDYTYLWNTGDTTNSIVASPGYYWVETTDDFGCTIQSDSVRVYTDSVPNILFPDTVYFCENASLVIDPVIESGTPPFSYDWGIYGSNPTITVGQENIFNLVVTDDNACTDTFDITVLERPLPALSFTPQDINICGGLPVDVSVAGAETYQWIPNIYLSSDTGSTVEISALSSVTYFVTGFDDLGCSSIIEIPVSTANDFDLQIGVNPVTCQGYDDGSIVIIPQNTAIPPLAYSIDGGQTYSSIFSYNSLVQGLYDVRVKDALGCVVSDTVVVGSAAPNIQVIAQSKDVVCYGDSTGEVSLMSISGGNITSGYTYTWFTSGTNQVIGTDSSVQVPVGGYYLVVEDDNGCQGTDEV
ncbi:MAG: choice-of-anchor L domain-containing protein, partial [Bacteroidota bacterium]|nr:choice-of-anchor L domain-containing protein [Bacteroidota bacterium]